MPTSRHVPSRVSRNKCTMAILVGIVFFSVVPLFYTSRFDVVEHDLKHLQDFRRTHGRVQPNHHGRQGKRGGRQKRPLAQDDIDDHVDDHIDDHVDNHVDDDDDNDVKDDDDDDEDSVDADADSRLDAARRRIARKAYFALERQLQEESNDENENDGNDDFENGKDNLDDDDEKDAFTKQHENMEIKQHMMQAETNHYEKAEPTTGHKRLGHLTGGKWTKKENRKKGNFWYNIDLFYGKRAPKKRDYPSDYAMNEDVMDILDNAEFDVSSLRKPENLRDKEQPYLGVLLDAGRHYFPIGWIQQMIRVISIMNYNYLHFRLTDDQAFNVLLESQPLLAYPSTLKNNTQVYSKQELRQIVAFAKRHGVHVIPEINVPGHAASWGGIPGLITQCPEFVCSKGYGIPLDVNHPDLGTILRDVLKEVLETFDDPPFLHLGGDEVHMGAPCFKEAGISKVPDHNDFEALLKSILLELKYDESKVIRWEMTKQPKTPLNRAGKITHFWMRKPGTNEWKQYYPPEFDDSVFLSCRLYFDNNEEDSAFDVYIKTKQLAYQQHKNSTVLGVVAGTFELDAEFWHDRNVLGKLLAVSMGVSNINTTDRKAFLKDYRAVCGSAGFPDELCNLYGLAPKRYKTFQKELKHSKTSVWKQWINGTCDRLTERREGKIYFSTAKTTLPIRVAKSNFWETYFQPPERPVLPLPTTTNPENRRLVQHVGVILDMARYPFFQGTKVRNSIVENTMAPLGFNTLQLRLVTDVSFAYFSDKIAKIQYENLLFAKQKLSREYPLMKALKLWTELAGQYGIGILPEIAVSTNAGGMYKLGFNVECPEFHCQHGKYIPQDISDVQYPPVLYTLIQELLQITSSPFIHLGHDERSLSLPCFVEANGNSTTSVPPNFDAFESILQDLLKFAGLKSENVIRWENSEGKHYPSRFGDITQCLAGVPCRLASAAKNTNNNTAKAPWFATVNVRAGGAYDIYTQTRELAVLSPLGIMAEIGPVGKEHSSSKSNTKIDYRLLAFHIGTLDRPRMDQTEFEALYVQTCLPMTQFSSFGHESICKAFASAASDPIATEAMIQSEKDLDEDLKQSICYERTRNGERLFMKDPSKVATAVSMRRKQEQETAIA